MQPSQLICISVLISGASHALSLSNSFVPRKILARQDSFSNVVRRIYHGSFILDETLYIDGGECTTTDWKRGLQVCNGTIAVDLSEPFSTSYSYQGPSGRYIDKGDCPNFNRPAFWVDSKNATVFAYGGEYSFYNERIGLTWSVPPERLWAFTAGDGGTWTNIDQSFDSVFSTLTRPSYGGFTYGDDIGGFYLGGMHTDLSSPKTNVSGEEASPGMQFLNFTSQSWANASTTGFYDSGTFVFGSLQFVHGWGDSGLVVVLGGVDVYHRTPYGWDGVAIFDPASQKWYIQETSGDIPPERGEFCNVGIRAATSNSTFEIFVYGGQTYSYDATSRAEEGDTLYILSLPAFHWFKSTVRSGDPRIYHTCNIAGNSQMLSVGGINLSLSSGDITDEQINTTDPYTLGIKVFNLNSLTWTDTFDPSAGAYVAPRLVQDYYAQQQRYPDRWNDEALRDIFIRPTNNATTPTSAPSPTPTPPAKKSSTNVGAIAGGVVGGVAGLALILAAIWFFCFRNRDKRRSTTDISKEPSADDAMEATKEVKTGELESPPEKPRQELGHGHLSAEGRSELPAEELPKKVDGVYELQT